MDGNDRFFFCGSNQKCLDDDEISGLQVNPPKTYEENKKMISGAQHFSLGSRFEKANLSDWIASDSLRERIISWLRCPKNFLIHQGNTGCGKTYFAAAMLNYLWDRKEEVFYTQIRRLIQSVQDTIQNGKGQYEILQKFAHKKILIIDDLGASANTEWQKEMILDLIDTRYEHKLPTIITTNLDDDQIKQILGPRTSSRLLAKENYKFEVWDIDRRGFS